MFKLAGILTLVFYFQLGLATYKRVCYYTNWSQYRLGEGKFLPSDIDPTLCTHLIFAFGKLVGNTVQKLEGNDYQLYVQIHDLKRNNPSLKTSLALGGWTAGSIAYSRMASTVDSRRQFIQSAVKYLRDHKFDGLDMDWEYPANRGGAHEDKKNFGLLAKELREAFDAEAAVTGSERLLLSAAVAASKSTIDTAYDVPVLAQYMDFINLMSYDLHGSWDATTGFNSPLFPRSTERWAQRYLNIEFAANYWHSLGLPKDKLIIGLATYGRTFTLSSSQTGVGAPARGPGSAGRYTSEAGFLSYYEICALQESGRGWTVHDSEQKVPYYTDGSLWVGFDDEISIAIKVQWLVTEGYGGAMVWSLPLDDFKQRCSKSTRRFPLTHVIKDGLMAADNGEILTTPVLPTGESSPASLPSTTRGTGTGGSEFFCVGKTNGLYGDTADCSRYYQCEGGRTFHMNCPGALLYNPIPKYCDYPENVVCASDTHKSTSMSSNKPTTRPTTSSSQKSTTATSTRPPSPTSTSTPATSATTTVKQTISPKDFCQSKEIGFYPDPTECSKFYQCYDGGAGYLPCPTGLRWNHIKDICDWSRNVDCSRTEKKVTTPEPTRSTVKQTTTTKATTTTSIEITTQVPSNFCADKANGRHSHPADCSKYVTCIDEALFVMRCPRILRFNENTGSCDWKYNVVCNL